jgi:pyrroloquinoline-quinone synthase
MMTTCREGSFQEGMATLHAYEAQIPEVSRVKIEGLKKFYGVTDAKAIKFFIVHQEADVYHSRSEREVMEKNTPPELSEAVQRASAQTARALWRFLDGVYAAYVARHVLPC